MLGALLFLVKGTGYFASCIENLSAMQIYNTDGGRFSSTPVAPARMRLSPPLRYSAAAASPPPTRPVRSSLPQPTNHPPSAELIARSTTQYISWR